MKTAKRGLGPRPSRTNPEAFRCSDACFHAADSATMALQMPGSFNSRSSLSKTMLNITSLALALLGASIGSFEAATAQQTSPDPVTFTTQEDHRNMLEQLGITRLRP